jgi:hypothetical protein
VPLGKFDGAKKLADSIQNSGSHFVEVLDLDKRVEYSAVAKPPKVKGGRLESAPPNRCGVTNISSSKTKTELYVAVA